MASEQSTAITQASTPDAPVTDAVGMLEILIEHLGTGVLDFVRTVLGWCGLHPSKLPGGELTLAWLGVAIFLPVVAFLAWSVRRLILNRLQRERKSGSLTAALLTAILQPVAFLIWVYAGLAAFSPLISRTVQQGDSTIIVPIVRIALILSAVGGLIWFGVRLIRYYERVYRAWTPGPGQSEINRPLLPPLLLRSARLGLPIGGLLFIVERITEEIARLYWPPQLTGILVIAAITWILGQIIWSFPDFLLRRHDLKATDNLAARKIFTQVKVIQRIAFVLLGILSLSAVVLLFPTIRQFGATILASAGVAGIILGLALQRTLGNLFAGIQIAFTQPIRIDDVVIVENEWGWIEEITLTYVVVKIWDWRRLVLPISYFIEKPFQNWTRSSASIIGTVFMKADYRIPVQRVRESVEAIVKKHPLWDGKVYCLQVTDCADQTVELRVLVSAIDSPKAWDLRCDIRESMLTYVQTYYPECLPRLRVEAQQPQHQSPQDTPQTVPDGQGPAHLDAENTFQAEMAAPVRER